MESAWLYATRTDSQLILIKVFGNFLFNLTCLLSQLIALLDYNSINKFLNRLLGVPVELQNGIFQFFSDVLAAVILEAKRTGKWDMGILDLGTNNEVVFRKETKFFVLNSTEPSRRVEMHTVSTILSFCQFKNSN